MIFCRNVLIYFHAEARRTAVGNLRRLLAPDGLLWSAPAEARIFSEAGLCSLGSECPFGFRHDEPASGAEISSPLAKPIISRSVSEDKIRTGSVSESVIPLPRSRVGFRSDAPAPREFAAQTILAAAEQAADNGRLEEADALCSQVLSRDPASAAAHYLRGVVRQAQGAFGEAQRSLERALYLDPRHYQALVHMMLLAQQRGDQPAATNYRRRAEQAAPPEIS